MNERLIRLEEVMFITGLAKSTIYKYVRLGRFPEQKRGFDRRLAVWRLSDVIAWVRLDEWPPADAEFDRVSIVLGTDS